MESIESSMKRWTWNEVEKCWELMNNDQIDSRSEDRVDQLNGLGNYSNIEGAEAQGEEFSLIRNVHSDCGATSTQTLEQFESLSSQQRQQSSKEEITLRNNEESSLQTSSQHLVREYRIDDEEKKVDDEIESIESSIKRWTWNGVEKCWELKKNGQNDGDEGNDEVDEVDDDDESDDVVDQLNGLEHELNIEGVEAQGNKKPDYQQPTLQQPQHQQINLDQFNANTDEFNPKPTQTTSTNQNKLYPLPLISLSLDQFNANFNQSSPSSTQPDIKLNSTLENSNLTLKPQITLSKAITSKRNICGKKFITRKQDEFDEEDGEDSGDVSVQTIKEDEQSIEQVNRMNPIESTLSEIVSDGQSCATSHDHAYDHQIDHLPSAPLNESASLICSFAECVDLTFNHQPSLLRHTRLTHSQSFHQIHCKPFTNVRRPTQSNHVLKIVVTDKMACSLCEKWFQWQDDLEMHVIQEHTVRTVDTGGFDECMRTLESDEEFKRLQGVHQHTQLNQQPVHQVTQLNESSNQSLFDCSYNLLLPDKQQQTLQQINLDQFNANSGQFISTQTTSLIEIKFHPLTGQLIFLNLSSDNMNQSCPIQNKPYLCTWKNCGKTFYLRRHLEEHMGIHTGEKRHECPWKDCTREFTYIVNLEQHFKVHTDMLPFKCPWEDCNREFLEFCSVRLHAKYHTRIIPRILKSKPIIIQNHTGKQPFLCTWKDCGKAFTRKYYLKIHKCIHTGERPYKCFWKDCDKVFTHSEQRIRHIKVHNDDKPFRCPWEDCRDEFVGIKHFQVHVSQVHTLSTPLQANEINEEYDDEKFTLQCNNDSSLHSSSNSHQHINSSIVAVEKLKRKSEDEKVLETEVKDFDDMHENAEKFYAYNDDVTEVDDMDGDGQFGVDQLNEHRSNIDGTESHGDQLGRNMPSAQVVEPDKSQTGKHLCVNCGKGFKQRSDLTRHFRKHTDDRPYECPHCGRSFAQKNDLKKHILIHTGERPHACEQCRKAFRSKSNLIRHWNVHKRNPVEVNEGAP